MPNQQELSHAKKTYENVCKALDNRGWKYDRHDEDLTIVSGAQGDDLPIRLIILVRPQSQVLTVFSPMQFRIPEDKRIDAAIAIARANYGLVNGSFDYDLSDGEVRFRMSASFMESDLSESLFMYMVLVTSKTVDDYNDKFFMLSKGMMSLQQFIAWEDERKG